MKHLVLAILLVARFYALPAGAAELAGGGDEVAGNAAVVSSEFIYDEAPFPECHASTIAETPSGLVAAWFGGTRERDPDVGIWASRQIDGRWTTPVEVANGIQYSRPDGTVEREPCWNPVLFQPKDGPLLLFYKCGPDPSNWWGMLMQSADGGADLVGAATTARGDHRSGEEQAGAFGRRDDRLPVEHGGSWMAFAFRDDARLGPDMGPHGAAQRWRGERRHSAKHFVLSRRSLADAGPRSSPQRQCLVDLVKRQGADLERARIDGPAKSEFGHRCSDARRRAAVARLQPSRSARRKMRRLATRAAFSTWR